MSNIGLFPYQQSTSSYLKRGFAAQVIILSFAVTERFKKIRNDAKIELKNLVSIRIKELSKQNEEMLKKSEIIENTNAEMEKLSIAARETEHSL